jgi:hypothetical protein
MPIISVRSFQSYHLQLHPAAPPRLGKTRQELDAWTGHNRVGHHRWRRTGCSVGSRFSVLSALVSGAAAQEARTQEQPSCGKPNDRDGSWNGRRPNGIARWDPRCA